MLTGTLGQVVAERDRLHALSADLNLKVDELHDDVKIIMKELKAARGGTKQAHPDKRTFSINSEKLR